MPDDKLGHSPIVIVLIVIVLGVFIAISSIRAWGPVSQAEAERLLWTPTPLSPTPTMHPDVAASKIRAGQTIWICVIISTSFGVLAGIALVGSCVARHIRVTVQIEPQPKVKALPRHKPVLIGSGTILDPEFNTRTRIDDLSEPNLEQGKLLLDAECAKVRAIADALATIIAKQPRDRTCVERKMLKRYDGQVLPQGGENEPTIE